MTTVLFIFAAYGLFTLGYQVTGIAINTATALKRYGDGCQAMSDFLATPAPTFERSDTSQGRQVSR